MAPANYRGQCAVESAVILAILAAILFSLHGFADISRTLYHGVTLSKETK